MAHFRVDRFANIELLESRFFPSEEFDTAAYTNKIVDMFAVASSIRVDLLCSNELMRVMIDDHGEDIPVQPCDEDHFLTTIEVNPSSTFYGWVFQFMGKIKILSPQKCVDEMRRAAKLFLD